MAMIKCPKCKKDISDKARKCVHCGFQLELDIIVCEECGNKLNKSDKECPKCGCPVELTKNNKKDTVELVAAKCPSCGANIEVDENKGNTKCQFCHSNILVKEAIEKYKIEISGEIEVKNLPKLDNYLKNGARYYDNKEYNEAYKQYNKVIELDPNNYIAVLRNGICNTLDTNYLNYNLNPLLSGIKEANKILGTNAKNDCYNQIAKEGYEATKIMENFAINFYKNNACNLSDLNEVINNLINCQEVYSIIATIVKSEELKKKILKSQIDLSDYLLQKKFYKTGYYKNGKEVVNKSYLSSNNEKNVYSFRNTAVLEYNKIVESNEKLAIKKQPSIRWDRGDGKAIIIVSIIVVFAIIVFCFDSSPNTYDYVQKCEGLESVKLIDIYNEYEKDEEETKKKYLDKAFIFEGKIYSIDDSSNEPMLEIEFGKKLSYIYVNKNEIGKLKKLKKGDNIKFCGIVKKIHSFLDPIRIENATIINSK